MKTKISLSKSLIIFTFLFIFLIIETSLLALGVVHPKIIEYVLVANSMIFILQIIFLVFIQYVVKRNKVFLISIAFISAFNILLLKLSYYQFFLQYDNFLQLVIAVILFSIFYKVYSLIQISRSFFYGLFLILASLIVLPFFQFYFVVPNTNSNIESPWSGEHREFASQLLDHNFIIKPNIHVIVFDALTPEILVRKFFNESEPLPYVEVIKNNNGVILENSFAMHVPTERSWASFFMLDQAVFDLQHNRFNGEKDTILFNLFRSNGYSIQTGFAGSYMGTDKGQYIDSYDNFSDEAGINDSVYCLSSENNIIAYFFRPNYDVCNSSLFSSLKKIYFSQIAENKRPKIAKSQELSLTYELITQFLDKVVVNISMAESSNLPWITFHHINIPGHVGSGFRTYNQEDIDYYYDNNYKKNMRVVSRTIENILEVVDDDSVVMIMGDHGPWISASMGRFNSLSDQDKKYFVQDRHGIFTSIINEPTECSNSLDNFSPYYSFKIDGKYESRISDKNNNAGFTSPARVLSGVIRCIVDKPKLLDSVLRFRNNMNFEKYLYE